MKKKLSFIIVSLIFLGTYLSAGNSIDKNGNVTKNGYKRELSKKSHIRKKRKVRRSPNSVPARKVVKNPNSPKRPPSDNPTPPPSDNPTPPPADNPTPPPADNPTPPPSDNPTPPPAEDNPEQPDNNSSYTIHKDITVETFYIGEPRESDNIYSTKISSAWDNIWLMNYGGVDTPNDRDGFYPAKFKPKENPFYFELPFNDFDENGDKKPDLESYIPWAKDSNTTGSICKNRWIKITKGDKVVYAQWEDVGPYNSDDKDYVFGNSKPKNELDNNLGLKVSPAVRDYLSLNDLDSVNWQFVDEKDVPDGPWKEIVTTSNINRVTWYKPSIDTTFEIQLTGKLNTSYNVNLYEVDMFDTTKDKIDELHSEGRRVICYFSAGTYENWRSDASSFPPEVIGKPLGNWEGENWLDISNPKLYPIMEARLDLAKEKGCDGIDADNVNGYLNDTGFNLTYEDQLTYNKFIATEARKRGLAIGLKNDLTQIEDLLPFYDFSINEQCHIFNECDMLNPFIEGYKPVFNIEYDQKYVDNTNGARDELCEDAKERRFQTIVAPHLLDGSFRIGCN